MLNETQTIATTKLIRLEVLQPEITHEIQHATIDELKDWIKDGKLLPNHQVRLKNLAWLNASDLQGLKPAFEEARKKAQADAEQPEKVAKPAFTAPVKPKVEPKSEPSEASIPFKIYEEKVLGKSKNDEDKSKESTSPTLKVKPNSKVKEQKTNFKTSSLKTNQTGNSIIKSVGTFLGGCVLVLLLSYGGSYLWIYSLRGTPKVDENRIAELAVLEQNIYNEKVNLRLRFGESNNGVDLNAEFAKLDKKLKDDRKPIIENYQQNMIKNDFTNLFYFSVAVLLVVFLLSRIILGKRNQLASGGVSVLRNEREIEITKTPKSVVNQGNEDVADKLHQTENSEIQVTQTSEIHQTNSNELPNQNPSASFKNLDELLKNPEYQNLIESENLKFCLLHRTSTSEFVCETCSNNFCSECVKTFGEKENCCPFCQVVCKPAESGNTKVIFVNVGADALKKEQKPKKEINLVVQVEEEKKTYRVGFVSAFLISFCFSISIAYFWVYEISPRLEPKEEVVAQKVEPNGNSNSANANTDSNKKVAYDLRPQNSDGSANSIQRKCVDPESKETFDCDEETYKALYDHTAKTKSVEEAQKSVDEKTNLILSPFLQDDKKNENSTEKVNQVSPEEEEKIANNRRKFFQIFGISFFVMFGGLLSTRLIFKDETKETEPNNPTE